MPTTITLHRQMDTTQTTLRITEFLMERSEALLNVTSCTVHTSCVEIPLNTSGTLTEQTITNMLSSPGPYVIEQSRNGWTIPNSTDTSRWMRMLKRVQNGWRF